MGGTLAEPAHYIQSGDGAVAGVAVLVNAARSGRLTPTTRLTTMLERRHGDAIREIFQIDSPALTAEEAQYLTGFRTFDEIRNRSVAAGERRIDDYAQNHLTGWAAKPAE
jgi:hypothetical protein